MHVYIPFSWYQFMRFSSTNFYVILKFPDTLLTSFLVSNTLFIKLFQSTCFCSTPYCLHFTPTGYVFDFFSCPFQEQSRFSDNQFSHAWRYFPCWNFAAVSRVIPFFIESLSNSTENSSAFIQTKFDSVFLNTKIRRDFLWLNISYTYQLYNCLPFVVLTPLV